MNSKTKECVTSGSTRFGVAVGVFLLIIFPSLVSLRVPPSRRLSPALDDFIKGVMNDGEAH